MSLRGLKDSLQPKGYQKIHLAKKKLAPEDSGASSVGSMPYITLIPIVVMPVMTVIAVSVGPVVCRPRIVAVVRIRSVVAIWIISGAVVTVSVSWITKSDSDSSDANRNLSV